MREIVSIQIGQCGNQVGGAFWDTICQEHGIDANGAFVGQSDLQLDRLDVFFNEGYTCRYIPRCVLVDLEPSTKSSIFNGPLGSLFTPENGIFGKAGSANNWAKGHNTDGAALADAVMDAIRRESEACDSMQGLQVTHSLGGGTGSGLGALISERIKEEYHGHILSNIAIFPSPKLSDTVVEPYNTTLSFHSLQEFSDECVVIDNEALYNIATKTLKLSAPTYNDINHLMAIALSGITASMRFPGQLNTDLRKLGVNLIPFPRLHFFMIGCAPLSTPSAQPFRAQTVSELTKQMFTTRNMMCDCSPNSGRYLAASAIFRGNVSTLDVESSLQQMRDQNSNRFVQWCPSNIQSSVCDVAPRGLRMSSTFIGNSTSIGDVFGRVCKQFNQMFKKKAFLHWYTNEGMELTDFSEAEGNIKDLIKEYQQFQDAPTDMGDEATDANEEEEVVADE